jgi:hypothetical protein
MIDYMTELMMWYVHFNKLYDWIDDVVCPF